MPTITKKGGKNMTGVQMFSVGVNVITAIVDIAIITIIIRRWRK
jgi:hypothetical protein